MTVKTLSLVAALIAGFGSTAAFAADEYTLSQNLPVAAVSQAANLAPVRVVAADAYQQNLNLATVSTSQLQRAQVLAEAIAAHKLGLIAGGEVDAATPTVAQAEEIRLAGLRAVGAQYASK